MFKGVGTILIKELKDWRRILKTLGWSILFMFIFLELFVKNAHQNDGILMLMGFGLSFVGLYLGRLISYWIKGFLMGRQDVRAHLYSEPELSDE